MGVKNILDREHELVEYVFSELDGIENIHILANQHQDRLGVISFYIDDLHFNLGVKLLNDKFGIQTRGGCNFKSPILVMINSEFKRVGVAVAQELMVIIFFMLTRKRHKI